MIDTLNGIPFFRDDNENDPLGRLLAGGVGPDRFTRVVRASENTPGYVSPFLSQYLRSDGLPVKFDTAISVFENPSAYKLTLISFEQGSQILDYYNARSPETNELYILYEKDMPDKSNLFGSFVMVKMGSGYHALMNQLKSKQTALFSHRNTQTSGIRIDSFEEELQDDFNRLSEKTKSISKSRFRFAFETEMRNNSEGGKALDSVFGEFDRLVIEATESINEAIESIKFVREDYAPPKNRDTDWSLDDYLERFVEINQEILASASDYAIPDAIQERLSGALTSFVNSVATFAKENLPKETIAFFEKAYATFKSVVDFFKQVAQYIASLANDALYLLKAFLMGFVNGLLSTIQMLVSLVGWILKNNINKKLTGQFYLELEGKLEFIEDLFDLVSESAAIVFDAVKNLLKDFSVEKLKDFLSAFKGKASEIDRFDTAFFAGSFIFEVVLAVVLAVFTGGATAVAEAANAAEKITALLKVFARELVSTATMGIVDILSLFKTLIVKFVQACKTGWKGFTAFIERLMASKADDVVKDEGRVLDGATESGIGGRKNSGIYNLGNIDELGSKAATAEELTEWEQKIKILAFKEKGRFKLATKNTSAFRYMQKNKVAAYFDAHEIPPVIWYSEGSSNYVIAHEYYHLEEYTKIGRDAFIKGDLGTLEASLTNNILREKYVAERLLENAEKLKLSQNELKHIKQYYLDEIINPAIKFGVDMQPEFVIKFKKYGL